MFQEDKALDNNLTLKRKRVMTYFIKATEKLIRLDGIDGLSIRKIAEETGYNSASIYNYFNDLEQLALFGSLCYLREYVTLLEKSLQPDMSALDQYRTIYSCFNEVAFRYPDIYHNMFFGKYSYKLAPVLSFYYQELFPDELNRFSERMQRMLRGGDVRVRDNIIMEKMVQEGDICAEKSDSTLDLIIASHQYFIYEACLGGETFDVNEHKRKFTQLFEYILAAGK